MNSYSIKLQIRMLGWQMLVRIAEALMFSDELILVYLLSKEAFIHVVGFSCIEVTC